MRIIGIDPGLDGAAAVVWDNGRRFTGFIFPKVRVKGQSFTPNWALFPDEMERLGFEADHAFIEKVGAMPKEGVSSAFKFGTTAGGIRGIVAMLRLPVTMVTPRTWKCSLSLGNSPKEKSVARACELFPEDVDQLTKEYGVRNQKQIEGVAEAALIGYYGYRVMKNRGMSNDN